MRQSRVDPTKSAHEVLEGPCDWNKYPLAPPGCKSIIHEAAESRAPWAPRGVDAWYLHPSKDHYRCNTFYVPETRAYRTSGSAEYYSQHNSNTIFSPAEHIKELKEEATATIRDAERTPSNKKLMQALKEKISNFVEGKVETVATEGNHNGEQLPTSAEPIPEPLFQRVTEHQKSQRSPVQWHQEY